MWYICFGNTCGCCNTTNCCCWTQNASRNFCGAATQTTNGCGCYNRCAQTATTANNGCGYGAATQTTNGNGGYYYGTFQVRKSGGGCGCRTCGYAGLNGDAYYARQYGFTTVDAIDY